MNTPDVSIIMPVYNVEKWVAQAIESCLSQTEQNIEIICVDDASTDRTPEIVATLQERDDRIRLITHQHNRSAFQARRTGIFSTQAPFVLFLDGDDELASTAVEKTLAKASAEAADLVGFGVSILGPGGNVVHGYQERLQPRHALLEKHEILEGLFPLGEPAHGQLVRYLFSTELLRAAYSMLPDHLVLHRVEDLPITFFALASAQRYVSIPDHLYTYHFRRGGSGHRVEELSQFEFYASGIESVDNMAPAVRTLAEEALPPELILDRYEDIRLSIIGNVLGYLRDITDEALVAECLKHLYDRVSETDAVLATDYAPGALKILIRHGARVPLGAQPVRNVLIFTHEETDKPPVHSSVAAQAQILSETGRQVFLASRRQREESDPLGVPEQVRPVLLKGESRADRIRSFLDVCRLHQIQAVIDHDVLQDDEWPLFAAAARAAGIPTIGVIHRSALQADISVHVPSQEDHLPVLTKVAAPSSAEVTFWKLRDIQHAVHLPDPPSLFAADLPPHPPRVLSESPLRLVWRGDQITRHIRELVSLGTTLRSSEVDFRLTVITSEAETSPHAQLQELALEQGIADALVVTGPAEPEALQNMLESADLFITTSEIEASVPAVLEAQTAGLPVALYQSPGSDPNGEELGLLTAPHGDAQALAQKISLLHREPQRYESLSRASLAAAQRVLQTDFRALYSALLADELPPEYRPGPSLEDARILLKWAVLYKERFSAQMRRRERRIHTTLAQEREELDALRQQVHELDRTTEEKQKEIDRLTRRTISLTRKVKSERQETNRLKQRVVELSEKIQEERR